MEPTSPLFVFEDDVIEEEVVVEEVDDVVVPAPSAIFGILKLLGFVVALSLLKGKLGRLTLVVVFD